MVPSPLSLRCLSTDNMISLPREKATILYFWCSSYPREISSPALQSIATKLKQSEIDLIGVSLDLHREDTVDYLIKMPTEIPLAIDEEKKMSFYFGLDNLGQTIYADQTGFRILPRSLADLKWLLKMGESPDRFLIFSQHTPTELEAIVEVHHAMAHFFRQRGDIHTTIAELDYILQLNPTLWLLRKQRDAYRKMLLR